MAPLQLQTEAQLFTKSEDDLLTALELEDHPIIEVSSFEDIAALCQQVALNKRLFAQTLNVPLQFSISSAEASELAMLRLKQANLSTSLMPPSTFGVPVDSKWLDIIVQKLVDIAILLASGVNSPAVTLSVSRTNLFVEVLVTATFPAIPDNQCQQVFSQYYGSLGSTTNLRLGSGLEGFIAKTAASELDLPLEVHTVKDPPRLIFSLKLSKKTSQTNPGLSRMWEFNK